MKHFDLHALERRIADVLKKGFIRPSGGGGFDEADATQAGLDIADMLSTHYRVEPHPYTEDRPAVPGSLLEAAVSGVPMKTMAEAVRDLKRLLAEPKNGLESAISPAIQAAGMGGGVGEEVR